ncbi:MAG: PEP-CTERM sorting domain-containing protein [Zoogloea sp.]|uniref:PEP-CTERM sorting domain-containing protein n=1 Tax=Zoogloea sp. TaxID=49181 RepID=UPI003F3B377A
MKIIRKTAAVALFASIGLGAANAAYASLYTDFSSTTLDPNLHLDIPNASIANISLNASTGTLNFNATSAGDNLWTTRSNAPFAWTDRPTVALGQTWYTETQVSAPTNSSGVIAGITFYGGPDGAGGSNQGQEFTFALDHWDFATATVYVQGLGDNHPGNSSNLTGGTLSSINPAVFLRTEITENGASDLYTFMYKLNAADNWTTFGSLSTAADNSRAAIFLKTASGGSASFDYFSVGVMGNTVPEPTTLGLLGAATGVAGVLRQLGQRNRRQAQPKA